MPSADTFVPWPYREVVLPHYPHVLAGSHYVWRRVAGILEYRDNHRFPSSICKYSDRTTLASPPKQSRACSIRNFECLIVHRRPSVADRTRLERRTTLVAAGSWNPCAFPRDQRLNVCSCEIIPGRRVWQTSVLQSSTARFRNRAVDLQKN